MALSDLTEHILKAVATAAFLGGGTMLLSTKVDVARQDERIQRIEQLAPKIETIGADVADTKETVARLDERLKDTRK